MYFYTDLKGRDGNGLAGVNQQRPHRARDPPLRPRRPLRHRRSLQRPVLGVRKQIVWPPAELDSDGRSRLRRLSCPRSQKHPRAVGRDSGNVVARDRSNFTRLLNSPNKVPVGRREFPSRSVMIIRPTEAITSKRPPPPCGSSKYSTPLTDAMPVAARSIVRTSVPAREMTRSRNLSNTQVADVTVKADHEFIRPRQIRERYRLSRFSPRLVGLRLISLFSVPFVLKSRIARSFTAPNRNTAIRSSCGKISCLTGRIRTDQDLQSMWRC